MESFNEVMDFCSYDLEAAGEMVRDVPKMDVPTEWVREALDESCMD